MSCSLFPPNTPLRTKIGVAVTVVYLLGLISLIYWKWTDLIGMQLNNLGDFAAGAFGPLAFLWLVIGYMQQGDELKQNTDALRLQAAELANTVEQQKALVELGNAQLAKEKEQAIEEHARHIAASRPKFAFSFLAKPFRDGDLIKVFIRFENLGLACSHLKAFLDVDGLTVSLSPEKDKSQCWSIAAHGTAAELFKKIEISISYLDAAGNSGKQLVFVNFSPDTGYVVYGEDDQRVLNEHLKKN